MVLAHERIHHGWIVLESGVDGAVPAERGLVPDVDRPGS